MDSFLKRFVHRWMFTIHTKLAVLITLLVGGICLFIYYYFPARLESQAMSALSDRAHSITEMMAFSVSPALYFEDRDDIMEALAGVRRTKGLVYIVVHKESGEEFAAVGKTLADRADYLSTDHDRHISPDGDVFRTTRPIIHNGQEIGRFYLGLSLRELRSKISASRANIATVSFVIFIVGMMAVIAISTLVTGPLTQMVDTAEKIADGDLTKRTSVSSKDEIGHLARAFNLMVENLGHAQKELESINRNLEMRVEERTKELRQEIGERKRAEQEKEKLQEQLLQAQKMKAIGTLAGGVAHDFNNLLTAIKGYAEMGLSKVTRDEAVHNYLEKIHYAGAKAADLTRQLLLFSRKQPMLAVACNVNNTIKKFLKMLDRLIGEDITIETKLKSDLWTVQADEGNIEQVIMNLAVNARDAMPDGGTLTIATENVNLDAKYPKLSPDTYPGQFVCMSVSDTGVGMSKDMMSRIFEPFYSTKGPGEGTGLGLSVVYGIVKEHKGWIGVYSEPGQGSIFKIYLPAVTDEMAEEQGEEYYTQAYNGNGERILLVEDEEAVRDFAINVLRESGYTVFIAVTAEEALKVFDQENGNFDLLFSDIVLPGLSGLQLVEQLRSRRSDLRILLCSGYSEDKSQWSRIREEKYRFLQKPYSINELLKAVAESMGSAVTPKRMS
jgi:signal transduction histidine kinase/ActR/RegA family two-component response regulator